MDAGAKRSSAAATRSPIRSDSTSSASVSFTRSSSVSQMPSPFGDSHRRPARPRPVSWASASTMVPAGAPASASSAVTSIVDCTSSSTTTLGSASEFASASAVIPSYVTTATPASGTCSQSRQDHHPENQTVQREHTEAVARNEPKQHRDRQPAARGGGGDANQDRGRISTRRECLRRLQYCRGQRDRKAHQEAENGRRLPIEAEQACSGHRRPGSRNARKESEALNKPDRDCVTKPHPFERAIATRHPVHGPQDHAHDHQVDRDESRRAKG